MGSLPLDPLPRFYKNVKVNDNGCWIWQGAKTSDGYGSFSVNHKVTAVHRWAYEHFVSPVPQDKELDHLCRIRACVNPKHLEPVTHQENVHRGHAPNVLIHTANFCKKGHEFTPDNSYISPSNKASGRKTCKICISENKRRYNSIPENIERHNFLQREKYKQRQQLKGRKTNDHEHI